MAIAENEVGDALAEGVTSDDFADLEQQGQERRDIIRDNAAVLQAELVRLRMTDDFAFVAPFGRVQLLTRMGSTYEVDPEGVREALAKIVLSENDTLGDCAVDVAFGIIPWQVKHVGSIPEDDSVLRIYRIENVLWEVERTGPATQPRFFYDIVTPLGHAVARFLSVTDAESVARRLISRLPTDIWEIEDPTEFRIAFAKSNAERWLKVQEGRYSHGGDLPF